jgi:hypothetical protein
MDRKSHVGKSHGRSYRLHVSPCCSSKRSIHANKLTDLVRSHGFSLRLRNLKSVGFSYRKSNSLPSHSSAKEERDVKVVRRNTLSELARPLSVLAGIQIHVTQD